MLVYPTPSAMRKMLSICDAFAVEYDIKFNAQKSKRLMVSPRNRQKQATAQTAYRTRFLLVLSLFHIYVTLSLLALVIRKIYAQT